MKKNLSIIIEQLSEKQRFILNVIIGFNGIILRAQLLQIMKMFNMDERTCSVIISDLKSEGIVESNIAFPNCKAVMIYLTRKANAAILHTDQKNIFLKTDSESNNLRQIFKTELMINTISKKDRESAEKLLQDASKTMLFLTKNNCQQLYRSLAVKQVAFIGEWRKSYDFEGFIDNFTFANMMSREYYFRTIGYENRKFKSCLIVLLAIKPINTSTKINNIYYDIMYIYCMLKRYFMCNNELKIQVNIYTINQEEANYIHKNFKYKKFDTVLANNKLLSSDQFAINTVSLELDKKYSIKRELI